MSRECAPISSDSFAKQANAGVKKSGTALDEAARSTADSSLGRGWNLSAGQGRASNVCSCHWLMEM